MNWEPPEMRYVTQKELDDLMRFPWWAGLCGFFFGLAFSIIAIALVLLLL